jgi:hypothetical protein
MATTEISTSAVQEAIVLSSSDEARRRYRGSCHPDVTGWQGSHEYFRFIEADLITPSMAMDVLRGRQLGVVFRDVVPVPVLQALIANFTTSPGRQTRGADAPGEYLGAYHYNKTIDEYLDQTDAVRADLEVALDVPGEPLRSLRQQLREAFALSGISFRPACHGGREACAGIFRSWQGQRGFALAPHEDRGQCESPKQAGFEIQTVAAHAIVGVNVCLDNGPGGRLIVWNLRPDEVTRARLGVQYTGSPYATESLAGVERLLLDVRPGDIYLLNSSHVHAVEAVRDADSRRVTLSMLLGFADDDTVISWT